MRTILSICITIATLIVIVQLMIYTAPSAIVCLMILIIIALLCWDEF